MVGSIGLQVGRSSALPAGNMHNLRSKPNFLFPTFFAQVLQVLVDQGYKRPDLTSRPLRFTLVREYLIAYAPEESPYGLS